MRTVDQFPYLAALKGSIDLDFLNGRIAFGLNVVFKLKYEKLTLKYKLNEQVGPNKDVYVSMTSDHPVRTMLVIGGNGKCIEIVQQEVGPRTVLTQ